jgi:hypothetical protein
VKGCAHPTKSLQRKTQAYSIDKCAIIKYNQSERNRVRVRRDEAYDITVRILRAPKPIGTEPGSTEVKPLDAVGNTAFAILANGTEIHLHARDTWKVWGTTKKTIATLADVPMTLGALARGIRVVFLPFTTCGCHFFAF